MTLFQKACFLIGSTLAASTGLAGNVWSIENSFDSTSWSSSQNNFLLKNVPTLSGFTKYTEKNKGGTEDMLTDGVMTKTAGDYSNTFGITSGSVEWAFDEPVREFLQLIVYSHWGDSGRDGIAIGSVEVTADGTTWTALANGAVSGGSGWEGPGRRRFLLKEENDEPLATNIVGLRINFPATQENGGVGCTEIEAIGTAKDVPMLNAAVNYVAPKKAGLSITVLGCGEGFSSVNVYCAYGISGNSLGEFVLVHSGAVKNQVCPFEIRNLQKDTPYDYSCYVENAGGERSEAVNGTFRTTDGSVLSWIGTVSGNWSDGLNWDSEEAPAANSSLAQVVLSTTGDNYAPANLDISGLSIDDLNFGADCRQSFAMSGRPLRVGQISTAGGASGTFDISNEVTFAGAVVAKIAGAKVRLAGPVHATAVDGTVYSSTSWNANLSLMNRANDFSGKIHIASGSFSFYSDGSLGLPPSAPPEEPDLANYSGNGSINAMAYNSSHLNTIVLDPNRWFRGQMTVNGGVDLVYNGPIDDGTWFSGPQYSSWHFLTLGGPSRGSSEAAFSTNAMIVVDNINVATIASQQVVAQPSRGVQAGVDSTVDLNGFDPVGPLATDGKGREGAPNFINSRSDDESRVSGAVRIGGNKADGGDSVLFGGLGDIRLEGDVYENADLAAPTARPFRKQGPGRLTIASPSTSWQGDTAFVGDVTLDYTVANTPKLGGHSAATMGDGTLAVVGNASGTTCELTALTLHYGLTRLATSGDVTWTLASLARPAQGIGNLSVAPAVDFSAGTGFRLADAAYGNLAGFGGIGPNATVNGGAEWAMLGESGEIGAMPATGVENLAAGSNSLWGSKGAVRAAAAGDMAVQISDSVTLAAFGSENAAGILYSSAAGGDLTISGGVLAAADDAAALTIQNWNTNHVLTISSRIAKADGKGADFDLTLIGPGTTILSNDENTFRSGPNVLGGGTVKFTSAKCFNGGNGPTGYSALGRAGVWNGDIYCGDGATYEYIGTDPDGAVCDRNFNASGEVTFKANGAGPLTIKHPGPVNPLVKTCRIVLDGDAGKGGGILSNVNGWGYGAKLNPGVCGEVVKRGTGKWAVGSADGVQGLRTTVEAGVLELLDGAIATSPVFVKSGATLQVDSGATLRRTLTVDPGATLDIVYDGETPAVVWGRAVLAGELKVSGAKLHEETVVLVAESGFGGTVAAPEGYTLILDDTTLSLRPQGGTLLLMR